MNNQTNTANEVAPTKEPSRQVKRANARRAEKAMRRYVNEVSLRKNKKR